ncbi:MAG: sugar ABC transporter substrate-binding protein [Clostridia bacterium]|nr:sugar ABC transporter substrate-binding protein [Clostridia bacterium]
MKKILSLVLVLMMAAIPVCAGALTIGYSTKTITNDAFQLSLYDAVKAAVEANGDEFMGVLAESQTAVATQVNQIEDLINMGVDGLIINPMDSNACIQVLEKAKEAGIPVVLVDQGVEAGHEDLYVTFISTDNFAGGQSAGERMAAELGGSGNVIIVRGANGSQAGDDRADGFKAGIEGTGLALINEQAGDWVVDKAMQVTENMIQANPDIQGIFCCSDNMLPGILQALRNNDIEGVTIISFDGSQAGIDMIKDGSVLGTVAQFPDKIGAWGVEYLMKAINGEAEGVESFIDAGTQIFDITNVE